MTEEDAKTKWCPHVRVRFNGSNEPASNMEVSSASGRTRPKCIASQCMMWVWRYTPEESIAANNAAGTNLTKENGSCGLAGAK